MPRTILITGTSTGIGYGAAKALSAAGYRVIATVRKAEDAERLARELGENLYPILCDVTRADQVAALSEHVKEVSENGWLDVLVNNAAIELIAPAELQPMEEIRAQFETNVFGLMAVTRALLPLLGTDTNARGHRGRIVNVSSVGGVLALPLSRRTWPPNSRWKGTRIACVVSCACSVSTSSSSVLEPSNPRSGTSTSSVRPDTTARATRVPWRRSRP